MDGILLIDKPKGWSSFDVIRYLRRVSSTKKIGHAGTLDPLATGLLILLFGQATKRAGSFLKLDKEYKAEITLGSVSSTDDAEGQIRKTIGIKPSQADIEAVLSSFVGSIKQVPPQHSAIKVGGKRAYSLARKGQVVDIEPRQVKIHRIELIKYEYPKLVIKTYVGSGTYIRSLARDIGEALNVGGYLTALRRTSIGDYKIADAHDPAKLSELDLPKLIEPIT